MVLSAMTSWFSSTPSAPTPQPQRALTINSPPRPPPLSRSVTSSDVVLADIETLRFLAAIDARLREARPLSSAESDRLEALYIQATADDCVVLMDILESFETRWLRLRGEGRCGAGSSSSSPLPVPRAVL